MSFWNRLYGNPPNVLVSGVLWTVSALGFAAVLLILGASLVQALAALLVLTVATVVAAVEGFTYRSQR